MMRWVDTSSDLKAHFYWHVREKLWFEFLSEWSLKKLTAKIGAKGKCEDMIGHMSCPTIGE